MSIKESNKKKNYSNKSDKNIKVAGTANFYIKNLLRDQFSKTDEIQKKLKIKKINIFKGRELATNFKKKT